MSDDTLDSAALAQRIAEIASDRKAIDLRVLDLRGIVSYTDFFVICTGNTERQTKAIHDALHEELKHADAACSPAAPRASAKPAGSCSTTSTAWSTSSLGTPASTTASSSSGGGPRRAPGLSSVSTAATAGGCSSAGRASAGSAKVRGSNPPSSISAGRPTASPGGTTTLLRSTVPMSELPLKIRRRYRVFGGSVADSAPLSHVVAVPLTRQDRTIALASNVEDLEKAAAGPDAGCRGKPPDQVPDDRRGVRGDAPVASDAARFGRRCIRTAGSALRCQTR